MKINIGLRSLVDRFWSFGISIDYPTKTIVVSFGKLVIDIDYKKTDENYS